MSDLRKKIEELTATSMILLNGEVVPANRLLDEEIDSILTIIEGALPELPALISPQDKSHFSDAAYYGTRARYNTLTEVKQLLQDAKNPNKESKD